MHLKRMSMKGFKSFADRVDMTFEQGVAVVVGPNGSGKSNIVDAIKWVLGERSSKSLRGKEMIDVIFAGSAARRPGGMASVTLTFENPIIESMVLDTLAGEADEDEGEENHIPLSARLTAVARRAVRGGGGQETRPALQEPPCSQDASVAPIRAAVQGKSGKPQVVSQ